MGNKAEQLSSLRHTKKSFRKRKRQIKRITAKKRRRAEKVLLDDTPPRVTEGWVD